MTQQTLEQLEETYQLQRSLEEGDTPAQIESAYVTPHDTVIIQLDIGATESLSFSLGGTGNYSSPRDMPQLDSLYTELGVDFSRDLEPLTGKRLTIESYSDETETLTIAEADLGEQAVSSSPPPEGDRSQKLSTEMYDSTKRHLSHEANTRGFTRVTIDNVETRGGKLDLTLDVYGKLLHWLIDIPDTTINSDSTYAQVVEEIGAGSVTQIEGSSVYVSTKEYLGKYPTKYENAIGLVVDELNTWVVFGSEQDVKHPQLTDDALNKHMKKMNSFAGIKSNHPDTWEKRTIPASSVDRVSTLALSVFALGILLTFLSAESLATGGINSWLIISGGVTKLATLAFKTLYTIRSPTFLTE